MEAITKKPAVPAHKPTAKKPVVKKPAVPHPAKPVAHKKPVPMEPAVVAETVVAEKPVKIPHGKNFYAVGRRKTSTAQVLTSQGNGTIMINVLPFEKYFQTADLQYIAMQPLTSLGLDKTMNVKAKVQGGGIHSQAEAFRHGVARSLIAMNPESRRTLKKLGYLKRDPRVKERKKPGLKRARRAPQFSKR